MKSYNYKHSINRMEIKFAEIPQVRLFNKCLSIFRHLLILAARTHEHDNKLDVEQTSFAEKE